MPESNSSAPVNTPTIPPVTVGDLVAMCGDIDPQFVTIIVRTNDHGDDTPWDRPVDHAFTTIHRHGLTELTLDLSE